MSLTQQLTKELEETTQRAQDLEARNRQLGALLLEYDVYLQEIAPFSYKDGRRAKTLREQKEQLLKA